jgi:hypothetical protein
VVLKKFVRNGMECTTSREGNRTFTRCTGKRVVNGGRTTAAPRHNIRDCVEHVIQSLTK